MSVKFKTKQKDIMAGYCYVIKTGYCTLQNLLQYKRPVAYTTRREGWGADIYEIDQNTVITTGYAPFGNITPDWKLVKQYDQKAADYVYDHRLDNLYNGPKYLDKLLKELVDKIIKEYKEKSK